jgi:hypothetical protein
VTLLCKEDEEIPRYFLTPKKSVIKGHLQIKKALYILSWVGFGRWGLKDI